ncbi:MAG: glycosyltransferase [Nitrospirae bacterium]|nr:MAG: glycosyltransferase [Nitrospirota bacterium]
MPKVTVYTVGRDYGRYLPQAIKSVLHQTMQDWELIVINDGSTDNTPDVLRQFESDPRIKIIHQPPRGLPPSCNLAISHAKGDYIIRLDADDYFDENALLVLSGVLDAHPKVGLVYPDYFLISSDGEILGHVRREKIADDLGLLDLPAHGAGTMIRRQCFEEVGGYDESVDCQDGYDLWVKFIDRYKVYNVNLPLFYYRRHPVSLSSNQERILRARRALKARHVRARYGAKLPSVLALVPVRNESPVGAGWALRSLGSSPILQYTLDQLKGCPSVTRAVVVTENEAVGEYARSQGVETLIRPATLARMNSPIEPTVLFALEELARKGFSPDIVCLLHANSPLRRAHHIEEAINTLLIFKPDSVISVCENTRHQYHHRLNGLEPVFHRRELRFERDALYEENGAVYVSWSRAVTARSFVGARVGHIIMTRETSLNLDTPYDVWLAEQLLTLRGGALAEGLGL